MIHPLWCSTPKALGVLYSMKALHFEGSSPKPLRRLHRRLNYKSQLRVFRRSRDDPASRAQKGIFNPATLSRSCDPSIIGTLHPNLWGAPYSLRALQLKGLYRGPHEKSQLRVFDSSRVAEDECLWPRRRPRIVARVYHSSRVS